MRVKQILFVFSFLAFLISCGGGNDDRSERRKARKKAKEEAVISAEESMANAMDNKGIGPVKSLVLAEEIDKDMALKGEAIFNTNCSACHKTTKKFIGPNPTGVLERRSPEWVMNMILNPEEMVKKDPIAKQLLINYNGSPMANQNLSEEEARQVLEYFRTL